MKMTHPLLPRPPSTSTTLLVAILLTIVLLLRSSTNIPSPFPSGSSHTYIQPPLNRSYIGKITMLYGNNPTYDKALESHDKHNAIHGYDMTVLRQQLLPGFWSKPAYILKRLLDEMAKKEDERLEWIVWFDVDILIMNPYIPLEIFLPPPETFPGISCLVTDDHRGLNNGVFFLRVNDWSVWLMTAVLGFQNAGCRPPTRLRTQDQGALELVIKEPAFHNHTIHVPQRWFNAFAGYRTPDLLATTKFKANSVTPGDLLVHFAGHKETREGTMVQWLKYKEEHGEEWEMELEKTGYMEEIKKFWDEDAEKEVPKQQRFFPGTSAMID